MIIDWVLDDHRRLANLLDLHSPYRLTRRKRRHRIRSLFPFGLSHGGTTPPSILRKRIALKQLDSNFATPATIVLIIRVEKGAIIPQGCSARELFQIFFLSGVCDVWAVQILPQFSLTYIIMDLKMRDAHACKWTYMYRTNWL